MAREAGRDGRELTVDGAWRSVNNVSSLVSSLSSTLRRMSKSATAAAGEAAQDEGEERKSAASKGRPDMGRHSDMQWRPCMMQIKFS
jgi:hypothetical protein